MAIQKIESTTVLERGNVNDSITLKNINFSYGSTPIIKNLSFGVKQGEIRAIIGPNGAGKSTVLHLLSGRNNPQSGDIIFKGKPITHLKPEKRRHLGMSRSFQITNIFGAYTVYENVRLAVQGMKDSRYNFWKPIKSYAEVHKETLRLIEECNLSDAIHEKASNLSYAQQRQVEIALSLAADPSLLLLDEPMAGLSIEKSKSVAKLVSDISKARQLTVIFIEHDMDIVFGISDEVTVLSYGEIVVSGKPEEIKSNPKVQEIYLGE